MNNFNINTNRLKRQILSHVKIIRFAILGIILFFVVLFAILLFRVVSRSFVGAGVGMIRNFLSPQQTNILTSDNRVNILLMGKGGVGHDAPDLTDTMILASISLTNHKVTLISIPRDIWIDDLKDKVNSAYMHGKLKGGSQTGIILAKSTVEEILGVSVDYGVVIDFNSFKSAVDAIGGINVNVVDSFTDTQFPIVGKENDTCNGDKTFACRYETVTFNAGNQNMDGDTALKFVRSRHANGIEGTDIAREARQQLVINAIFKKIIQPKVFANPTVLSNLLKLVRNNIETDMKANEAATIARYAFDAKANVTSYTIPGNLLFSPTNEYLYHNDQFSHAFVFVPNRKDGKWNDVQSWVQSVLTK